MTRQAPKAPHLAALLSRHQDDIATTWAEMAHDLPRFFGGAVKLMHVGTNRHIAGPSGMVAILPGEIGDRSGRRQLPQTAPEDNEYCEA